MKIFGFIIATPFILFALFTLARFLFCGPDKDVEKVAFPLAKAIVEHMEKKGVPETLNDVEGLPYELKGCSKSISNLDEKYTGYSEIIEKCTFFNKKEPYKITQRVENYINNSDTWVIITIKSKNTDIKYIIGVLSQDKQLKYKYYPSGTLGYVGQGFCTETYRPIQ